MLASSVFHRPPGRLRLLWIVAGSILGVASVREGRAAGDFNLAEARRGVVFIRRVTPGREVALGSGFLVSPDGLIYTSRHVIEPSDATARGTVVLVGVPSKRDPDDLDWFPSSIVYRAPADDNLDFAILKIAAGESYGPFHAIPLSYAKLELGASVAVIGFPYIRENEAVLSFNKGSISSTRVRFSGKSYYQTDAAVNKGNSGGPLLNVDGEAVGIITLKEVNAENVGFALYLDEVRSAAAAASERLAEARPPAGPVDPRRLELPISIAPLAANWQITQGHAHEESKYLLVDNHGGPYWVTSRSSLPENFQLVISCAVEHLQGSQQISAEQRKSLRRLYVRFGAPASDSSIDRPGGYLLVSSHSGTNLYRGAKLVKGVSQGNAQAKLFTLSITRQGPEIEVAVDGKVLFSFQDDEPLSVRRPFSIGGHFSRLYLGDVTVIDLSKHGSPQADEAPAPAEASALESSE